MTNGIKVSIFVKIAFEKISFVRIKILKTKSTDFFLIRFVVAFLATTNIVASHIIVPMPTLRCHNIQFPLAQSFLNHPLNLESFLFENIFNCIERGLKIPTSKWFISYLAIADGLFQLDVVILFVDANSRACHCRPRYISKRKKRIPLHTSGKSLEKSPLPPCESNLREVSPFLPNLRHKHNIAQYVFRMVGGYVKSLEFVNWKLDFQYLSNAIYNFWHDLDVAQNPNQFSFGKNLPFDLIQLSKHITYII